jgi:hypothetical protein
MDTNFSFEELMIKYKDYRPLINYHHKNSFGCLAGYNTVGWHCAIHTSSYKDLKEENGHDNDIIHVRGISTPLEALMLAIEKLEKEYNVNLLYKNIVLKSLINTNSFCPTIYEGWTISNEKVYCYLRFGEMTIFVGGVELFKLNVEHALYSMCEFKDFQKFAKTKGYILNISQCKTLN